MDNFLFFFICFVSLDSKRISKELKIENRGDDCNLQTMPDVIRFGERDLRKRYVPEVSVYCPLFRRMVSHTVTQSKSFSDSDIA